MSKEQKVEKKKGLVGFHPVLNEDTLGREAKTSCKKCHGRGYVGIDSRLHVLIPCKCTREFVRVQFEEIQKLQREVESRINVKKVEEPNQEEKKENEVSEFPLEKTDMAQLERELLLNPVSEPVLSEDKATREAEKVVTFGLRYGSDGGVKE